MARPQIKDETMDKLDVVVREEYDLDPSMLTTDDKVTLVLKRLDDSDDSTGKRTGSTSPTSSRQPARVDFSDGQRDKF